MVQSVIMDKMVDALVMQVQFLDEFVAPVWCRFHRCSSWTIVVPVCGDTTGAVLGQGYGDFDRCRGPDSAYRLEVPQLQLIFKDFVISYCGAEADPRGPGEIPQLPFLVVFFNISVEAQRLFLMVQTVRLTIEFPNCSSTR